jgi:GntR family transcriptional regulator
VADPQFAARPDLHGGADVPAHARISGWLEELIASQTLQAGDRLPAEVEFADALGVSRMTLRQALAAIEGKGLIDRRRGRAGGNFVAAPRFEFDHATLPGFTEQMRRMRVAAGAQVLRARTVRPAADVREHLGLSRDARVHELLRARSADGEPIVLEEAYVPVAVVPELLSADLTGSLYALLRARGAAPFAADEQIEATRADQWQAGVLGIEPGDPLLLITRTARTEEGVAVEFSRDYHRWDRTRIRITSRVDGG